MTDLKGKKVTVVGLGESGFSAARLLKKLGARVRVSELRDGSGLKSRLKSLEPVECEAGGHTRRFISESDLVVMSPGVAPDSGPARWAAELGIPVIGELELGCRFSAAPVIAVTGTNGKSTVASLIHEILKANSVNSFLLGNIGRPLCEDAPDIPPEAVITLEASSFQLERIDTFRPKVAVMLNLTRDHLDRYKDMDSYRRAKLRVFENQGPSDYAVLDYDDPSVRDVSAAIRSKTFYFSLKRKVIGGYAKGDGLFVDLGGGAERICRRSDIGLPGAHNLKNVLAAALAVRLMNEKYVIAEAVRGFRPLRHRFETVAEIGGVRFIDDSKSTTVDSTMAVLEASRPSGVILIAGGRDKGGDYSRLMRQSKKIKYLVLIGEARKKIRSSIDGAGIPVREAAGMKEAVSFSKRAAAPGDTVLLSPMCSSFDMFRDYKERGEAFIAAVAGRRELCRVREG